MAVKCPVCSSADVQFTITGGQCLSGGHLFDNNYQEAKPGPDASTQAANAPKDHATVIVGNLADLQRMGANAADASGATQETVVTPPAYNPITPAELNKRQADFFEAVNGPLNPEPRENKEPNVVDPGSQSPQRQSGGDRVTTTASTPTASTTPPKK